MDIARNVVRTLRAVVPDLVEIVGLSAIVYAVALAYVPAAFGVGGGIAVLYANVHDPKRWKR